MCVFLFLIIIIIVIVFCEFPQKNSGMNGEHSEKNGTRWKEWSGKKNSWLKKIEWRRAIFDLDYPFWQLSKSSEHIWRKKKVLSQAHIQMHIPYSVCSNQTKQYLGVSMLFRQQQRMNEKPTKKNNLATHRNRNQKNVFIEDCTFVAAAATAAAKFIISFT